MREPWTWGSRVALVVALAALILAAAGCAGLRSPSPTSSGAGLGARSSSSSPSPSPSVTASPSASPTTASTPRAGGTVTISSQNDGSTIVLQVGQELVVDLPNAPAGDSGTESARSSDLAVLRSLTADQPGAEIARLPQAHFQALSVGTATVSTTGEDSFSVLVEVLSA